MKKISIFIVVCVMMLTLDVYKRQEYNGRMDGVYRRCAGYGSMEKYG